MDTSRTENPTTTPRPRRRRRSKWQLFKEAYLPTIILAVTAVLIVVFIAGAITNDRPQLDTQPPIGTTTTNGAPTNGHTKPGQEDTQPPATQTQPTQPGQITDPSIPAYLLQEAAQRLEQAEQLAAEYDYEGALAAIIGFSGNLEEFPELLTAYQHYTNVKKNMVSWSGGDVLNLSFHILIADPVRAFKNAEYGSNYRRNFVTITEFSNILQQLYDNGYVLVQMDDFYTEEYNTSSGRYYYKERELRLPAGKTPIMITETHANYYQYMTDSNDDGVPDAGGAGFASRLCYDGTRFYNELVEADGSVSMGSYDVVPILEDFIAEHPDFSYRGARAIIAFSGYDGVLGYRINSTKLGAEALQQERDGAVAVVQALKDAGYDLACYTYGNFVNGTLSYGDMTPARVNEDIQRWLEKIVPIIGSLDIMVYAKDSDIAGTESYSGNSKFNVLYNAGFRFFLGTGTTAWNQVDDQYVRQNRLNVTASNLLNNPQLYEGLFDPSTVMDSARG